MQIFGQDIKFDASAHITIAMFALYFIWFFIDQNKSWRTIYFIFSLAVISIISIQRILVDAHNDIGLLAGLLLSLCAIIYSQKKYFKDKFKFYGRDIETLFAKVKIVHGRRIFGKGTDIKKKLSLKDLDKGLEVFIKNSTNNKTNEEERIKKLMATMYI
jgi:hypothetical protein